VPISISTRPWSRNHYYGPVRNTGVNVYQVTLPNSNIVLLPSNSNRLCALISPSSVNQYQVGLAPINGPLTGYNMTQTWGPMLFHMDELGPVVTGEIYANGAATGLIATAYDFTMLEPYCRGGKDRPKMPVDTSVNTLVVTMPATPGQIVGPNPRRKAIIICPNTASSSYISFDSNISTTKGLFLNTAMPPVMLTEDEIGTAVRLPIFGFSSPGTVKVTIYEIVKIGADELVYDN
jgi:hypothetical protein